MSDNNDNIDRVSEALPPYGKPRRMKGKTIVVTEEEMKYMDLPSAEPEWMAELEAEADRRDREKAEKK